MLLLPVDQVHDQLDHHLLFPGIRARDKDGERRETGVVDLRFTVLPQAVLVFLEEPDEEKRTDAFVPVREWVVFYDEIEEVRRLFLDGRVQVHSVEGRDDIGEDPCETLIFLIPEELGRLAYSYELRFQLSDCFLCFLVADNIGDILIPRFDQISRIEPIQKQKTLSIIRDDIEDSLRLVFIDLLPGSCQELDGLPELIETLLVDCVTLDEVFAEASGGPDTESGTLFGIHPVSDGDYGIEIVVLNITRNLSLTFFLNCSEIPNSCQFLKFTILKDMLQMLAHIGLT